MIRTLQEKKSQQRVNDFIQFAAQGKWENMETMLKNSKAGIPRAHCLLQTGLNNSAPKRSGTFVEAQSLPMLWSHSPNKATI